jgi:hypothetical protein
MKKSPAKIRRAVHEAGHAVVALERGLGLEKVTIIPADSYKGAVFYSPQLRPTKDQVGDFEFEVFVPSPIPPLVYMAALAAEQMHLVHPRFWRAMEPRITKISGLRHAFAGLKSDTDWAGVLQGKPARWSVEPPSLERCLDIEVHLRPIWREAIEILSKHWAAVRVISDELLLFGEISGERCRALFDSAPVRRTA